MSKRDRDARLAWDIATYFWKNIGVPGNQLRYDEWSAKVRNFGLHGPAGTALGGPE